MPSIFPKNHLSKDPQTWNAFIGQMQLNMHAIKCMCCCSARSALSCSSDRFILRHHRSHAQWKWSRLLDGSPRGPLLSSFQSFSDKTLRLQEKKQPPCLEKQKSMLSNSRNNHFHLSVFKEGEGKGRQEEAGGQHYNIATLSKQFSSVQLLSRARLFVTPWTIACQASLSPAPRACSNSCPSSQWCYPTISSSVIPFSSCLQSFPASGSFPMIISHSI